MCGENDGVCRFVVGEFGVVYCDGFVGVGVVGSVVVEVGEDRGGWWECGRDLAGEDADGERPEEEEEAEVAVVVVV